MGNWQDKTNHNKKVSPRGKSSQYYHRTGWTSKALNDFLCGGGPFPWWEMRDFRKNEGKSMTDAVVTDYLNFANHQREGYIYPIEGGGGNHSVVTFDGRVLPCAYEEGSCWDGERQYFWDILPTEDRCPFFHVRSLKGYDIPADSYPEGDERSKLGDLVVGEVDNNNKTVMIQLRKQGFPVSKCGGVIQFTEVPNLALTRELDHPKFNRHLPASEASPFLHAAIGDLFLHESLQSDIEGAVLGLQQHQCHQQQQRNLKAYTRKLARQKAVSDGDTAHLGGGVFLTAAGDAGYIYKCRPFIVQAHTTNGQCYNSLPVRILPEDEKYFRVLERDEETDLPEEEEKDEVGNRGKSKHLPTFFLEPRTHRLLTTAAPMICIAQMAALYQNKNRKWLAYDENGLRPATSPAAANPGLYDKYFLYNATVLQGANWGLYAPAARKRFMRYLQATRMSDVVVFTMEEEAAARYERDRQRYASGSSTSSSGQRLLVDIYDNLPDSNVLFRFNKLAWLWAFLDRYGQICTIFIATVFLWRILMWLGAVLVRLCSAPKTLNPCLHIFQAFFPELATFFLHGKYKPDGPRGPFHEIVAALASKRPLVPSRPSSHTSSSSGLWRKRMYGDMEEKEVEQTDALLTATTGRLTQANQIHPTGQEMTTFKTSAATATVVDASSAPPPDATYVQGEVVDHNYNLA